MATTTTSQAGRTVAENATARRARLASERVDTTTPLRSMALEELPADLPDVRFTRGPARRPVERPREPLLQWSTGLQTKERTIYAGWLVEAGRLDDLDQAMDEAGFSQVTIKHGSGNLVNHWALPTACLFVICDGVQTIGEMASTADRFGIAFGWRVVDGRQQSQLRCRVLIQELCEVGYTQPLLLSLKSTLTGDLLGCLTRHYETLDSINPIRKAAGKPEIAVPFYAVSIALGAGREVARGSGGQTREIAPMCEVGKRDQAYIKTHWCKREWVQAIETQADSTILWSRSESVRIAAGDEGQEDGRWES